MPEHRDVPLAAVPLFAGLDRHRLLRLATRSTVRILAAGSVVAVRGQRANHLIVVEAGALSAVRETADGRRLRLGEFAATCAVDKSAVLGAGEYTATWLAATRVRLRLVPAAELLTLVDDVGAARRHVLTVLSRQLRDREDELVRGRLADTVTRTAAWLVRAAGHAAAGDVAAGNVAAFLGRLPGVRVVLPGAQQGLAEAIGASRVSVNRALRSLASDGLIRTEPGAVVILAPELLAQRADVD
jgi:CRP/FNR family transcriptional regulator